MPYSREWDESRPPGSTPAADIDTAIQHVQVDIRERIEDILPGWTTESEDPKRAVIHTGDWANRPTSPRVGEFFLAVDQGDGNGILRMYTSNGWRVVANFTPDTGGGGLPFDQISLFASTEIQVPANTTVFNQPLTVFNAPAEIIELYEPTAPMYRGVRTIDSTGGVPVRWFIAGAGHGTQVRLDPNASIESWYRPVGITVNLAGTTGQWIALFTVHNDEAVARNVILQVRMSLIRRTPST